MQITVKDLKQNSHVFNDVDSDQTVASFAEEVIQEFKYTDGVKLIYCGKILEHNKLLSEYFKEVNNGYVVCMPEKTKKQTESIPAPAPAPAPAAPAPAPVSNINTNPNLPRLQPLQETNNTHTYSIDQIRAILLVFTRFIKVSPELFYMFCTNDTNFQSFLMSPVFASQVLTPLIEGSSQVLTSLQNGIDVAVQIPIFGYTQNNNTNNTNNNTTNTINTTNSEQESVTTISQTTGVQLSTNSDILNTPITIGENTSTTTTFTEQDLQNIKDLCEFGFQESQVIRVYVMANRNKELAASMLYEFTE